MRNRRIVSLAFGVAVVALVSGTQAQVTITPPGVYWSKERIAAELEKSKGSATWGLLSGKTVTVYPEVQFRTRLEGPNHASIHCGECDDQLEVDELVYIVDGSGTFMTGGTVPPAPETGQRNSITGGVNQDVKPGDFIIVPAGTSHWFSRINGHVTMLEMRFPSQRSQKK